MKFKCLICHDEGTDEEELIKLHENIDHHGHLSCLNTYYRSFRSFECPLCGKRLEGVAENLVDFNLSLYRAADSDRLDLFEMRLAQLAIGDYRYKPRCPRFRQFVKKWNKAEPSDEYKTSFDYRSELRQGIVSTVSNNQVAFLQLLLNHISNSNITLNLSMNYEAALHYVNRTCARMILETVLNNQAALAGNRLFEFLRAAICFREMEAASLILQKGIGIEFRKDVILNLGGLHYFIDSDLHWQFYESMGQWPLEELDYGLRYAALDGNLQYCNFLIGKGASITRTGVGCILLRRCVDQDDRDLLQYVSQCLEGYKVEAAKSKKGKWTERVKLQVSLKLYSFRLKLYRKPIGY